MATSERAAQHVPNKDEWNARHDQMGSHCRCSDPLVDALEGVLAAARYVLEAEDVGYTGHAPMVHLRQAVEAFDAD